MGRAGSDAHFTGNAFGMVKAYLSVIHIKDKCTVEKITFGCPAQMVYYRIKNGGHHWPGAKFNAALFTSLKLGNFCRDIQANDIIREFILSVEGH